VQLEALHIHYILLFDERRESSAQMWSRKLIFHYNNTTVITPALC